MSLLLMSKPAEQPFYYDKLNIRLFCAEELAYCIHEYPLLAVDGMVTDNLIEWIGRELQAESFARKLQTQKEAGESQENMLLEILQTANYYTMEEIRAFRDRLLEMKKIPRAQLMRATARNYFQAGRLVLAEEKYRETVRELDHSLLKASEEQERTELREEKADVFCDLAAVRMLRFDEAGAMRFIGLAEETGRCRRAEEYRYLISGQAALSEEEKTALDSRRRELRKKAADSQVCGRIRELSGLESKEFFSQAREIIRDWKRDYRKTC